VKNISRARRIARRRESDGAERDWPAALAATVAMGRLDSAVLADSIRERRVVTFRRVPDKAARLHESVTARNRPSDSCGASAVLHMTQKAAPPLPEVMPPLRHAPLFRNKSAFPCVNWEERVPYALRRFWCSLLDYWFSRRLVSIGPLHPAFRSVWRSTLQVCSAGRIQCGDTVLGRLGATYLAVNDISGPIGATFAHGYLSSV